MTPDFSFPWDQPCWLILNTQSLLSNLDHAAPSDSYLDLRSPLLARAASFLHQDVKRRGFKGFMAGIFSHRFAEHTFREGWQGILCPPFTCSQAAELTKCGYSPILGLAGEAIFLSNHAQTLKKGVSFFLRVRGSDFMADQGPASLFSILELIPSLPRLELAGFFLDDPFSSKPACDAFSRAVTRVFPSQPPNQMIGRPSAWVPHRFRFSKVVGGEILGITPTKEFSATLTLQAWGVPVSVRGETIRVATDLGHSFGLPPGFSGPASVEDVPARIVAVEEWRSLLEIQRRPDKPTPWKITLFGASHPNPDESQEIQTPALEQALEKILRQVPFYAAADGTFTPIP